MFWLDIGGGSGALRGRYADGAKRRFVGLLSRRLVVKCGAVVICASVVQEIGWRGARFWLVKLGYDYMTCVRRGAVRGRLTLFQGVVICPMASKNRATGVLGLRFSGFAVKMPVLAQIAALRCGDTLIARRGDLAGVAGVGLADVRRWCGLGRGWLLRQLLTSLLRDCVVVGLQALADGGDRVLGDALGHKI